jgi:hypothetical protein
MLGVISVVSPAFPDLHCFPTRHRLRPRPPPFLRARAEPEAFFVVPGELLLYSEHDSEFFLEKCIFRPRKRRPSGPGVGLITAIL